MRAVWDFFEVARVAKGYCRVPGLTVFRLCFKLGFYILFGSGFGRVWGFGVEGLGGFRG